MKHWVHSYNLKRLSVSFVRNDRLVGGPYINLDHLPGQVFITFHVWRYFLNVDLV